MNQPKANTADPWNGKTPQQLVYAYAKNKHFCPNCRTRWVEANRIICDVCDAREHMYRASSRRKRTKDTSRQPRMLDIITAVSVRGKQRTFVVSLMSDMGRLFSVTGLESVDWTDATKGAAKITTFRHKQRAAAAGE